MDICCKLYAFADVKLVETKRKDSEMTKTIYTFGRSLEDLLSGIRCHSQLRQQWFGLIAIGH